MLELLALGLGLGALWLYWELVLAEGVHLGPRVVVGLYNWVAPRYEAIKRFDPAFDAQTLAQPLLRALGAVPQPRILDVAAGTGRMARALAAQPGFNGRVVNLDPAAQMLQTGRALGLAAPWLQATAQTLPFPANTFDAVTFLEALEFVPDMPAALAECVRVLRPGGVLVVTQRIGPYAWLMLRQNPTRRTLRRWLTTLPLTALRIRPWQVEYNLAWARKIG